MNLQVKYFVARLAIFVLCALPAFLLLPAGVDPFLKLLLALVVSSLISFVVLRQWAERAGESWMASRQRRREERARLRATLAGEDHGSASDRPERRADMPE